MRLIKRFFLYKRERKIEKLSLQEVRLEARIKEWHQCGMDAVDEQGDLAHVKCQLKKLRELTFE